MDIRNLNKISRSSINYSRKLDTRLVLEWWDSKFRPTKNRKDIVQKNFMLKGIDLNLKFLVPVVK